MANYTYQTSFEVNIDAITASSRRIGDLITREGPRIQTGMRNIARQLLLETFETASEDANRYGGFPVEFQQHVLDAVSDMFIDVYVAGNTAFLQVDFEGLGTREDLKKAFHQGAKLAGGGFVDGPYQGEELANDNAAERHVFWEAVRRGQTSVENPKGPGKVPIRPGAWDETIEKYLEIWGEQAPEWLYLQFGQNQWAPTIPAQNVIGTFQRNLNSVLGRYLEDILDQETRVANTYQTTGVSVGFTSKGGVRLKDKPFTHSNGKTYRPGQFIPKNL